ncbi:LYR motif-containing protein 4 isoform X1 [Phacochoerus africanus]|uniref:LYR motif-containing protein 4 isoform X1 n=1 Tax=Phacochoerus africanus TaxID=41426 RepID=UPI001FDA02D1|nr:LYR motif-containing protein 4 isoform X1 [Phacochoerus africanus]
MAASSRAQVLDLYRAMLRESKHFSAYNYRTYAIRRIRDAFRENKNVGDPAEIQALVTKAKRNLGIIRRQAEPREPRTGTKRLPCSRASHSGRCFGREWSSCWLVTLYSGSTLASCTPPTSLSLRIQRSPGPRERDQPPPAAVDHLQRLSCSA